MAAKPLQFETETIQVTKTVQVAQVTISPEDLAAAILEIVKAAYQVDGTESIRLPDYNQQQGMVVAVVRDLDA